MQYRAGREIVQLEAVELQKPAEKGMNLKSKSSYEIRDETHPLSFGGIGAALRLLSAIIGGESGSDRDHIGLREKSVGLKQR